MTQVTYHGGPLISHIEVVSIYLNVVIDAVPAGDWSHPDLQQMASSLNHFLDTIIDSAFLDTLTEYSEGTPYTIGRGKRLASYFLTAGPFTKNDTQENVIGTSPAPSVLDEATAHNGAHVIPWLKHNLLDGALPSPTSNRCYMIFLPPGITLAFGIGLHDSFQIQLADGSTCEVYFVIVVYSSAQKAQDVLDDLTLTISHELVECITNPSHAHNGWHADEEAQREIGDICEKAWYNHSLNGYQVASFWSWKHQQCICCPLTIQLQNDKVSGNTGSIRTGQIAHFSVDIPCIPKDSRSKLTYHWTVSLGAITMGSDTEQDFFVMMPVVPGKVKVTVSVGDTVEESITQLSTTTYILVS